MRLAWRLGHSAASSAAPWPRCRPIWPSSVCPRSEWREFGVSGRTWCLGVVLCLMLWPAPALAGWDSMNLVGVAAYERDDYAKAEKFFGAALELAKQFGADDPRLAKSLNNLG